MDNLLKNEISTVNHFPDDGRGMIRDYCYVGDVVKANLAALKKGAGDFFNIGTGTGTRTHDLYDAVFHVFKEARPQTSDRFSRVNKQVARPGDLKKSCLVVEKARRILGWEPETNLEEGIRKTLKWRLSLV
jgi:UDP-glucose 4-epimerase